MAGTALLCRIWENLRKGSTPDMVAEEQNELVAGLEVAFTALDRIQKAAESFEVWPLTPRACFSRQGVVCFASDETLGLSVYKCGTLCCGS